MSSLDQVLDQMACADLPPLPPGHPILDGAVHRFGPKRKCWYLLHEFRARNGKVAIVGAFGRWSGNDNGKIPVKADFAGIEPDEYRRLQASQAELQRREREKREKRARSASGRAYEQWRAARAQPPAEPVPYLSRKGLAWENGLRVYADGTLLIPMVRYDVSEEQDADPSYTGPRRLAGLQKIQPDGTKLFNRDMAPTGASCRLGRKPKDGDLLLVGEGFATVASVHQGLERAYTCYVAFTSGNLEPVATMLRRMYPASPILFLADDDAYLERQLNRRLLGDYHVQEVYKALDAERELASTKYGRVRVRADLHQDAEGVQVLTVGITADGRLRTATLLNAGRTAARAAARAVGKAWVVHPEFTARVLVPDPDAATLTDWNDLHLSEGIGQVVRQVGAAIEMVSSALSLAQGLASGLAPIGASGAGRGGGVDAGEPDWQLHDAMLRRFTQIYPSETAYDHEKGRIVKVEHMRLRFGRTSVGMWLASRHKRVIDPEQIVFDPSERADPAITVNLFRGLPALVESGGSCKLMLELIHYLCGEDHEDAHAPRTQWLLRWLAYPLQHLGAKLQTAVVMHGEEGTGKNLVFGTVRKMYGRHGGVITQRQLEDKFNSWQSAKLFMVANEVVTRQEMTHQAGYLRNLITEPEVVINPKFQDQREEANHMNLAFLANSLQPLLLSLNDRRCFVIRTPGPLAEEFYKRVGAELAAGGVAAFWRYLRELDTGDFNEHTKPLMTEAKQALIELGMSTPQLFWQELKAGLLGLPYVPALATDLYRAYCVWCGRNGYKMPEGMKFFSPNFMSMNGVRRVDRRVPVPGRAADLALVGTGQEKDLRKLRVFIMGTPEADEASEKLRIARGVLEFNSSLREYLREDFAGDGGAARQGQGDRQQAF